MENIPDGFGKSKKKMEETFKQYRENYDALKADLNELTKYVKAEDFKDDGAAKLKTLTESLQNKLNIHHQKREEVYAIMNPVADAAEETLLKDHPLKKQILSSKKLLVEVDHLMQQIQDQHEGETFNEAALQSSYDKVEKLYNDNSKLKVKGEEYKRQASSFEDFNKEVENFLGATRKLIRDAKTQNAIGDADAIKTSSGYDLVISRYNNFVN